MPTAKHDSASVQIAAAPGLVYRLITDVTRMGEWSPECYRCAWLDGVSGAVPGARFRGYNRLGRYTWQTTAVVKTAHAGRSFSFTTIHDKTGREETAWRYELSATADGTCLTESFEFLWCPVVNRLAELPIPRGSQVSRGIRATLTAIKAAAEAAPPREVRAPTVTCAGGGSACWREVVGAGALIAQGGADEQEVRRPGGAIDSGVQQASATGWRA